MGKRSGSPCKKRFCTLALQQNSFFTGEMFIIKQVEPYASNRKNTITKMKKIYFYDLGMRNMIYNSFNDMTIRTDNGAIFENYLFHELIKNALPYAVINYYRTRDGAEVDFVLDTMTEKKSFEVNFKTFEKPRGIRSLELFNKDENIKHSYLINLNLNVLHNNIRYLPSVLISKVFG